SPLVMASRSGLSPIPAGVDLACSEGSIPGRFVTAEFEWNREPRVLRVLDGPQASWFQAEEFYSQEFGVLQASNRMGLRLKGAPLSLPDRELTSEPVCPGSVQVTRVGQCIVLGVDGQTIGGYPKIAQVIQADLDALGQLRPGQHLRFAKISIEEAAQRDREAQRDLRRWALRLQLAASA